MSKHTPGPWEASEDCGRWKVLCGAGPFEGQEVADLMESAAIYRAADDQPDDYGEANARLIAAAPELLQALKAIFPFIPVAFAVTGWPGGDGDLNPALAIARARVTASIAAAEGDAP